MILRRTTHEQKLPVQLTGSVSNGLELEQVPAIDTESGEATSDPAYKTLVYRLGEAPAYIPLAVALVAYYTPSLFSIVVIALGMILVIGETAVYLVRFRSLPPFDSWNPPPWNVPFRNRTKGIRGIRDRLNDQRFKDALPRGLAIHLSMFMVITRAGGLYSSYPWSSYPW